MLYWIEQTTSCDGAKPQTNEKSFRDCYETIEAAVDALREKHKFDVDWHGKKNMLINEYVEDGINSFYHIECGPFHKVYESVDDKGNGVVLISRHRDDQDYFYIKAVIKECKAKDVDDELANTKNEFVQFLNQFIDKTRFQITVECGDSLHVPSRPFPYNVMIHDINAERKNDYDKIVSFLIYKVKDVICIKMHTGSTSIPLIKTNKLQTTTWYENFPQVHSHYVYNDEQKELIKDKLIKKYLK